MKRDWYTAQEAAEILGVTRAWIGVMLRDGLLDGLKVHERSIVVSRESVHRNAMEHAAKVRKNGRGRGRPRSA